MNVDLYERIWMWGVGVILALFFSTTAYAAFTRRFHPPSHIETIDPGAVLADPRFAAQGVSVDSAGRVSVAVVGLTFAWLPASFTVPAETPITFRITSVDVTHGFEIVRTNGQSMVIPGYVSQFTTRFNEPGDYLVACNEYCGTGHHIMAATMTVVPPAAWQPPGARTTPNSGSEHDHDR